MVVHLKKYQEIDRVNMVMKVYQGNIQTRNKRQVVTITKRIDGRNVVMDRKRFDIYDEAWEFLKNRSDFHGFTKTREISYLDLNEIIPEDVKQYCAGVIDGDGSIGYTKNSASVQISQSYDSGFPPVLLFIKRYYGGSILGYDSKNSKWRKKWLLYNSSREILEMIEKYCILKSNQASLVLNLIDTNDTIEQKRLKDEIIETHKTENYQKRELDFSTMCPAYIAGLFDAEGCVALYKETKPDDEYWSAYRVHSSIAQRNSTKLLHGINEYINKLGTVTADHLYFQSQPAVLSFLSIIYDYLIGKKEQADVMNDYLYMMKNRENVLLDEEEKRFRIATRYKLQELKRL